MVMVASPGSSQFSATLPSPGMAERLAGASGRTRGVADASDAGPVPLAFSARRANVYVTSLVRPAAVCDVVVASLPDMSAQSPMSYT